MQYILRASTRRFSYPTYNQTYKIRGKNRPNSTLDLIFTNEEHMVENIEFLSGLGKSDHLILEFDYTCFSERMTSKHVHRKKLL